jgi:hypothetical protein
MYNVECALINNNFGKMWKEAVVAYFRYYAVMCLAVRSKTPKSHFR